MNEPTMLSAVQEIDYFGPVPGVDYDHLPDEPWNPLMENPRHHGWIGLLVSSIRNTMAATDALVTGNVPFVLNDGGPHLAPDVMVIPGARHRDFGRFNPVQATDVIPSFCLEVLSKRNSRAKMAARNRRLLGIGLTEVYMLDPRTTPEEVVRVTLVDGELVEQNALGVYIAAANITFGRVGDELGVCCPGGRMVTYDSDPFQWVQDETWRADQAELRADMLETARLDAERRVTELEARLREIGHETDSAS